MSFLGAQRRAVAVARAALAATGGDVQAAAERFFSGDRGQLMARVERALPMLASGDARGAATRSEIVAPPSAGTAGGAPPRRSWM